MWCVWCSLLLVLLHVHESLSVLTPLPFRLSLLNRKNSRSQTQNKNNFPHFSRVCVMVNVGEEENKIFYGLDLSVFCLTVTIYFNLNLSSFGRISVMLSSLLFRQFPRSFRVIQLWNSISNGIFSFQFTWDYMKFILGYDVSFVAAENNQSHLPPSFHLAFVTSIHCGFVSNQQFFRFSSNTNWNWNRTFDDIQSNWMVRVEKRRSGLVGCWKNVIIGRQQFKQFNSIFTLCYSYSSVWLITMRLKHS